MRNILRTYKGLEKHILFLIIAELFIQLINASFLLILNIYMSKEGYADYKIADFVSYRFLGVLSLAFPLGLYIRGRKLKPLFFAATIGLPAVSILMLQAVYYHWDLILYISLTFWGIFFTCIQVTLLPFILRNCKTELQSEAISLNYAMWSVSTIFSGLCIYIFSIIDPIKFNEKFLLELFCILSFAGVYFVYKIDVKEKVVEQVDKRIRLNNFDWLLISKALLPTMIIAIGAGLSIPFINLFFFSVHHIDSDKFSFIGSISAIFVTLGAIIIPHIKRKYGYPVAITWCQTLAVIALMLLASTDFYSHWSFAAGIAVLCFLLRQPLMNMAAPMTSELVMSYVGERNQEMVSALTSAIWSGSWFISARIFKMLREANVSYGYVFLTTAVIYSIGVLWYHFLIKDYAKKLENNLILIKAED